MCRACFCLVNLNTKNWQFTWHFDYVFLSLGYKNTAPKVPTAPLKKEYKSKNNYFYFTMINCIHDKG